ncbi:MAG: hypothetical protein ABGX07_00265 [Pirellulaceae bacterium]|nr:hypothetical protein [Planctomycetaceae bacterium]HIM31588.1 hypothetical protein [Planctomycetota bacterium]
MHWTDNGRGVGWVAARRERRCYGPAVVYLMMAISTAVTTAEDALPLHGETTVRFANKAEATQAFQRVDRFIRSMSKFDLESRLDRSPARMSEFLEFSADQFVPWTDEQKKQIGPVVESLRKRLDRFNLPLPKTVLLVQTTGKVEGNAAYCRANAIMLSPRFLRNPRRLESLLAHELFHVLSSHNPELRYRLYRIIGFQSCPPIPLPEALKARKITNPDAPELDCIVKIDVDGKTVPATPFLWAKSAYEPGQGKTFFNYMQFRLLVLKLTKDGFRPQLKDGEPWFVSPNNRADLYWNIGINTGYIIHPEEVLADNFRALVMKTPNLPSPRIPEAMLRELQR